MMNALSTLIENIKQQGKMRFFAGATEFQIADFEATYNVTLPEMFKNWLLISDGGEFFLPAGVQLYGVAHKPIIDVNDDVRPSDDFLVIGALAAGDPILCRNDSEQIFIYNQEANRIEEDEVYKDFYSFLADLHKILGIGG